MTFVVQALIASRLPRVQAQHQALKRRKRQSYAIIA